MTGDAEQLRVPHPLTCKLKELREVKDTFGIDLLAELTTGFSLDKAEALIFVAFRRQGLTVAQARKAAAEVEPVSIDVDEAGGEDPDPNPSSSVGS